MVDLADWSGLVSTRSADPATIHLVAPIAPAGGTWSGPFRGLASDGKDYFIKTLDTCPAGQQASLATERIVSLAGALIGAPVCHTPLMRIDAAMAGWEPKPGVPLTAGVAHASEALQTADEHGRPSLYARNQDDNRRRHVGVYALYDWCWGADPQWLYDLDADRTLYSHDHGLYLPPGGGLVNLSDLQAMVDVPHELPDPRSDLSPAAVDEIATALETVSRNDLSAILNSIPSTWPVGDDLLEGIGWFLEQRAPAVAQRVRALV